MQLRGFDAYEITLGDEMRGERASLGKSLDEIERDLRIKSNYITAIEDCDLSRFPNRSVAPGYVRSYARYLKLDPDRCYRQFCEESGYQPQSSMIVDKKAGSGALGGSSASGAELGSSSFAPPLALPSFNFSVSLGTVFSSLALVTTLFGLGYGGYSVLQDIQRVGFAPVVEAPDVVVDAPKVALPESDQALRTPDPMDYEGQGALAGLKQAQTFPAPVLVRRDGPISAIDPESYGVFAATERPAPTPFQSGQVVEAEDGISAGDRENGPGEKTAVASVVDEHGIAVHAAQEAWIRVIDDPNIVLFQGILEPGQSFAVPESVAAPSIRAGNAGGVYIRVDGVTYGPIGEPGRVIKDLALEAETIRARFPKAEEVAVQTTGDQSREERVAVDFE
ncbi:MAG: RodZ domain-containing protein [Pseudomonadota bacterium]